MTPQQFADEMRKIAAMRDEEASHGRADELMCKLLRELGYGEGVTIFVEMDKWYA